MISNEAIYIPFAILLGHAPAKRKEAVRMATTQMSLRMDEDVKRMMDATASAIGITSATAMNIFARQFVAAGGRGAPRDRQGEALPTPEDAGRLPRPAERMARPGRGRL